MFLGGDGGEAGAGEPGEAQIRGVGLIEPGQLGDQGRGVIEGLGEGDSCWVVGDDVGGGGGLQEGVAIVGCAVGIGRIDRQPADGFSGMDPSRSGS